MPELTGLEVIKLIKERNVDLKTVMITGYPNIKEYTAKLMGADEYLSKPFAWEQVEEILEKYEKQN